MVSCIAFELFHVYELCLVDLSLKFMGTIHALYFKEFIILSVFFVYT